MNKNKNEKSKKKKYAFIKFFSIGISWEDAQNDPVKWSVLTNSLRFLWVCVFFTFSFSLNPLLF